MPLFTSIPLPTRIATAAFVASESEPAGVFPASRPGTGVSPLVTAMLIVALSVFPAASVAVTVKLLEDPAVTPATVYAADVPV